MILLCNTFITETKPSIGKGLVFRENLKQFSNFDIFKYSLASLAVAYPWSKVIFYVELDEIYKDRENELEQYIKELFQDFTLIYRNKRNEFQNDWKQTYDLLDHNLIWFYCNHDHIFFDSGTEYLQEIVENIKDEELCSIQFSHWPENIRTVKQGFKSPPHFPFQEDSSYRLENNYAWANSVNFDSIQIITKELYKRWWFEGDFHSIKLPRPDYFGIGLAEIKPVPLHKTISPFKEICRHFDGYQHIQPAITNNQCPAIDIPPGFFEGNIKIRYGYDDYKEGWLNINPKNPNYYAFDISGTDGKFTLQDLPLVWKSRISFIDSNPEIDEEEFIQYRLKAVLEMIYTSEYYHIDETVKDNILNNYLKPFNYKIDA